MLCIDFGHFVKHCLEEPICFKNLGMDDEGVKVVEYVQREGTLMMPMTDLDFRKSRLYSTFYMSEST